MENNTSMTIGLDVSARLTHVCGLDDTGAVVLEESLPTAEPALRSWFSGLPRCRVALEVGRQSPWMSRLLTECGHDVIVANPRKVRLITSTDSKNDRMDAEKLARLARVDPSLLFPVRHRREDTQAVLAIVRSRETAVEVRTKLINTVRAQVVAMGGKLPGSTSACFSGLIDEVPESLRAALAPLMKLIATTTEEIRGYDRLLEELAREVYPETEVLRQVWGVGVLTALTFVLIIEVPERFEKSRDVGAYLGLRPRQDQSGDVDKQLRITKAGDALMRRLLVQCAHRILSVHGPDTDLKRWGLRLREHGGNAGKKRALVAVARKLAVLLHRLWVTAEVYEPLRHSRQDTEAA